MTMKEWRANQRGLRDQWEKTGNPLFVWVEIAYCLDGKDPLPEWVNEYLRQSGRRMLSKKASDAPDLRSLLPWIFDFRGRRGPGQPFRALKEMRELERYPMEFAAQILSDAQPAPAQARSNAAITLSKHNKHPDDRTLQRHLTKFFKVKAAPQDNEGWRKIVVRWLLAHYWYEGRAQKFPDLQELILQHHKLWPGVSLTMTVDGIFPSSGPTKS
jgi:hypothetical protein